MHKRLYKLIAVLLLPVFLIACEKHEAGNQVDKDLLASTLQKAMDTAKEIDSLNMKAYGMARVGAGMASVDSEKSMATLNAAYKLVMQARDPRYVAVLAELQNTTAGWPAAEKDQVADAIDRIEKGVTRVWVARAIAEGLMLNDPATAATLLMSAANAAVNIPDQKYRDLDLRSVAALMANVDLDAALNIAGAINDPRIAAWAFTEIGGTAAKAGKGDPVAILGRAADAARRISGAVQPSASLLVPDASDETKDAVLGAESAKIAAEGAHAMGKVAAAMSAVDHARARMLADEAAEMAAGIDEKKYGYTRAYAMSDVAMDIAAFNSAKAVSMVDGIDAKYADARVAAMLAVIAAGSGSVNSSNMLSSINSTETMAEGIADDYDRAKALAALARAAMPYSKEKAAEMAGKIEEELGHGTYAFSAIKNDVLADVAVSWVGEDNDMAKKIVDPAAEDVAKDHGRYIVEPRFCKEGVLRTKAAAYMGMGDKLLATDEAAAMKLYTKAAGAAGDCKSSALQWALAERMCKVDSDKLFDYAATIAPGDFENQALALTTIAADWTSKQNPSSGMVWDMAAKAANMIGDDMESSAALNRVAAACAGYDRDKATEIYAMSMRRIEKIGAQEG